MESRLISVDGMVQPWLRDRYDSNGAIFHCCVSCFDNARVYTTLILGKFESSSHFKIVKYLIFRENVFLFRLLYGKKEVMSWSWVLIFSV